MGRPPRARKPDDPPSYRGGRTHWKPFGYVEEHCPEHPACSPSGFVLQHRLVMEDHIGRYLSGLELVHHINGERADNRIENLQVVSQGEHARIHNKGRSRLTEEMVREALVGRTTKEAAKHLGVVHQTIRNQFDHLLKKRKKKYTPDDAELREAILKYHDDPTMGTYEFVHKFHVAYKTIVAMCEHLGVQWVKKKRSDIGLRRKPRKSRIKANDSTSGLDVHGES